MSIYIKGMKMPKDCWMCNFVDREEGYCLVDEKEHGDYNKPENCPLVPVPPHGDLIERDALMADAEPVKDWTGVTKKVVWEKQINRAPVIIPAEEADHA